MYNDGAAYKNRQEESGRMQLAIIGGGPAGLSAAIRAKEEGLADVWVIERSKFLGGILNQCIHHGFGVHIFKEELTGPEYAQRLIDKAKKLGVNFAMESMVIDIARNRELTYISGVGLTTVKADAIILAMGCRERPRGSVGIPGARVAGIFAAGVAQELVNMKGCLPGKQVVILGSGDIGLIMARRLTLEGAKVMGVYEIMPYSGGLKRNIAQCLNDYDIPLHLSHTVTRTVGQKRLEGVYVAKVGQNWQPLLETEHFVPCDTLLLSVGLIPENELSKKIGVALSPITGGALVNNRLETSVPGVFSCGNVLHVHDLVDHVTLEAYEAATYAVRFVRGESSVAGERSKIIGCDDTDKSGLAGAILIKALEGVRYTVPTSILPESAASYTLSFRSDKVYMPGVIKVLADGEIIKIAKKRIIIPSEMEKIEFKLKSSVSEIAISVE